MKIFIIITLFYILPAVLLYIQTRKSFFNPKGKYYGLSTQLPDVIFIFVPFLNICILVFYYGTWRKEGDKTNFDKFFNK